MDEEIVVPGDFLLVLVLDCLTACLGDGDADISLNILTLLLWHGVLYNLVLVVALLLSHSLAHLIRNILALLPGNLLALPTWYIYTHLLVLVIAVLLRNQLSDQLLNILAALPRDRSADRNLDSATLLNSFIVSVLLWDHLALLPGYITALLSRLIPTLLLRHIITDHLRDIMARPAVFDPVIKLILFPIDLQINVSNF